MNDLDERLRQSGSKPSRPLRADFTTKLLEKLEDMNTKPKRRPKWMEYLQRGIHKPALAGLAIAGTLVIGGSAYAAVGGISGIRALFGSEKTLADGSRIVQVDTQNCPHVDAFNITNKNRSANGSYYYKISAHSKLTSAQVVSMVQGACEADAEGVANGAVVQSLEAEPQNKDKLVGGYADSMITAITPTSLSIRSVVPFGSSAGLVNHTITQAFTKIDPDVMVVSDGHTQAYSTLKVGDHISVVYRATGDALTHSETLPPDQVDASAQTIVIVTRLSSHMSAYYDFHKYNYKDFEQVAPCSKNASGYCTAEQL